MPPDRVTIGVVIVAPGGWRVVPITVVRGGRRAAAVPGQPPRRVRVRVPEEVAAAGVPIAELVEDEAGPEPKS